MTRPVPQHWAERAKAHDVGNKTKFAHAFACKVALYRAGFKGAQIVHAVNESGEVYGEAPTGPTILASELAPMFADNATRQKSTKEETR